jgi:hypothetical protein
MGRRVEKCVYSNNTLTSKTLYVYDGFKCVEELDALDDNAVTLRHTWQPFDVGLDVILATKDASGTSYFLHDANKNVMQKTSANGTLQDTYAYAPFGEPQGIHYAPYAFSKERQDVTSELVDQTKPCLHMGHKQHNGFAHHSSAKCRLVNCLFQ